MIARYEGRGLCDPQKAQQIVRCHLPERITRLKSKVSTVDAYVFAIQCFFQAGAQSRAHQSIRACILSLLALECKSSASRNLRPNPLATALPTSDLPEPDTPVRTIATPFPGGESIVVIL
jgi:hypothetical protein